MRWGSCICVKLETRFDICIQEGFQFLKDSVFSQGSSKPNMLVSLICRWGDLGWEWGKGGTHVIHSASTHYLERVIPSIEAPQNGIPELTTQNLQLFLNKSTYAADQYAAKQRLSEADIILHNQAKATQPLAN